MQICTSLQTDNHANIPSADALPAAQPTASKHCIKNYWNWTTTVKIIIGGWVLYFFSDPVYV